MAAKIVPSALPNPVTVLGHDGTDFRALLVDTSGRPLVTVYSSVLPVGAATEAKQDTEITSLQLIDDLRNALASVATNSLNMRGVNSYANILFGYNARYSEVGTDLNAAGGNVGKDMTAVPAGEIWVVQHVWALDANRILRIRFDMIMGAGWHRVQDANMPTANWPVMWTGEMVLAAGDYMLIYFVATVAGDDLYWGANGYKIKVA